MEKDYTSIFKDSKLRMKNVGLFAKLFERITKREETCKGFGFTIDEMVNIVFITMNFIFEENISNDQCTLTAIRDFYHHLASQGYIKRQEDKSLNETCENVMTFILNKVLSNDGAPDSFIAIDFLTGERSEETITYLKNASSQGKVAERLFSLTEGGRMLLFSTLEYSNKLSELHVSIDDIVIMRQMESGNFQESLQSVKKLYASIYDFIHEKEDMIYRVRKSFSSRIMTYSYDASEDRKVLNHLSNSLDKFKKKAEDIAHQLRHSEDMSQYEHKEEILCIEEILSLLDGEIRKVAIADSMVHKLESEITKYYRSFSRRTTKLDLDQDVLQKIYQTPDALSHMSEFLFPLFFKPPERSFHLDNAYLYQMPQYDEEEDREEEYFDEVDEELMARQQMEAAEMNLRYKNIADRIVERLIEKGHDDLQHIISQNAFDYGSDPNILKNVAFYFLRKRSEVISINNTNERMNEAYRNFDVIFMKSLQEAGLTASSLSFEKIPESFSCTLKCGKSIEASCNIKISLKGASHEKL